ncbi:MAG: hypothetical protein K6E28_06530 [Eubacterium sp.]|nr:hypothetical protein [Eubacterium sp.]
MRLYINDAINEYIKRDLFPWHMPGHKRKTMLDPLFEKDFTEVPGLDDLHHPEGIIKDAEDEIAKVYGSGKSFFLVNGSTSGIMAAIFAAVSVRNGKPKVLVARNCHKSVFNAIELLGAEPVYVYPERINMHTMNCNAGETDVSDSIYGGLDIKDFTILKDILASGDIACAVITSPTYEGFLSDINGISSFLHEYGIPLIVDEAHGAHLPFCDKFGRSAIHEGADMVIQSLHKTLPALTQTAVLHIASSFEMGDGYKPEERVRKYLRFFMSSSPSYVFLANMERCIAWCDENRDEFDKFYDRVMDFRKKTETAGLHNIELLPADRVKTDPSRLTFVIKGMSGRRAAKLLEDKYGIVVEMTGESHIVLISSVMDTGEDFMRLESAIRELDVDIEYGSDHQDGEKISVSLEEFIVRTDHGECPINYAIGLRSRDYIYMYPPGSPIIAPGDTITKEMSETILACLERGGSVRIQ